MPYIRVKPSAPIATLEDGVRKIYNFLPGNDGYDNNILYVDYWDGTQWLSADQGLRSASPIRSYRPTVIAYQEGGVQKIYVFVCRDDNHVWVHWWDGARWQWADQGTPGPQLEGTLTLAAISYEEGGIRKIYVFAAGADNHLYVNWWNGAQWQWADQGSPGTPIVAGPAVVTYSEGGRQRIYAFVHGANNHVYVNYWDGDRWQWADQGDTGARQQLSAIAYEEDGVQKIYVFALGSDNRLRVNWWDGSRWQWADQGRAGPDGVPGSLSAITYEEGGIRKIYVFTIGADAHLRVNWWDGSQWQWADQGIPGVNVFNPAAITFNDGGGQRIYVFVIGVDWLPYINWWNGSQWGWHRFRIVH